MNSNSNGWSEIVFREKMAVVLILFASMVLLLALVLWHTFVSEFTWKGVTPVFSVFTFVVVLAGGGSLVWYLGVREQAQHQHNLKQIPHRIHVNGIRGKSTVTRLIGGALREDGIRTMTKTTGKAARLIDTEGDETPIIREVGPNIREQVDVIEQAMEDDVEGLVIECMAIHPELQRVAEHKMVQATVGVITNVRADHLDVLGPTLDDIAGHLSNTVPENAVLVTAEERYLDVIKKRAKKLGTEVIKVDPEEIDDELMSKFSYLNFKENVAIALEVSRQLGIPDDVALRGMLKAKPDPGLMTIQETTIDDTTFTFINAFGVNDKDSTSVVYQELKKQGYFDDKMVVGLFHARGDRVSRTVDFGKAMGKEMDFDKILLVGSSTKHFMVNAGKAGYRIDDIENVGRTNGDKVVTRMTEIALDNDIKGRETVFFGFGNMVGDIPADILDIIDFGAVHHIQGGGPQ
jgi:poly-gamma-glutamate synthase PgsB/CapB